MKLYILKWINVKILFSTIYFTKKIETSKKYIYTI
jgi:hypothetical protein